MSDHHPALLALKGRDVQIPEGMYADFLGIKTRTEFEADMHYSRPQDGVRHQELPAFDEEYFEWIDVIEAASAARDRFVMFELGAGYGRWLVRAVTILQEVNALPFDLVAVEAEPTHFRWLEEHLTENGIDPTHHRLIEAAVDAKEGFVSFQSGNPAGWYGQSIDQNARRKRSLWKRLKRLRRRRAASEAASRTPRVRVKAVPLLPLLAHYERIDLIDLDVQGAELDVLAECVGELDARVKRLHIGTHGKKIEEGLRQLFTQHRWKIVNDYGCFATHSTPYGEIEFQDGVQTWVNPRLASS